jgi:hypothetical protein
MLMYLARGHRNEEDCLLQRGVPVVAPAMSMWQQWPEVDGEASGREHPTTSALRRSGPPYGWLSPTNLCSCVKNRSYIALRGRGPLPAR